MVSSDTFSRAMVSVTKSWVNCTRVQRLLGELLQPVAHGLGCQPLRQATEPRDERVAGEIPRVLQTSRAGVHEREDQQAQAHPTVVPAKSRTRSTQPGGQREPLQVAHSRPKKDVSCCGTNSIARSRLTTRLSALSGFLTIWCSLSRRSNRGARKTPHFVLAASRGFPRSYRPSR